MVEVSQIAEEIVKDAGFFSKEKSENQKMIDSLVKLIKTKARSYKMKPEEIAFALYQRLS